MEENFYKNGIRFKCQSSSNCCISRGSYGYVYLSHKDVKRIANFFNISINTFKNKYCAVTNGYIHLKEINASSNCRFLKNKKCSIYINRPSQCRTWPFWKENMNAKKWNENITKFCPGIGKGELYNKETIDKKILEDQKNEKNILKEINSQ